MRLLLAVALLAEAAPESPPVHLVGCAIDDDRCGDDCPQEVVDILGDLESACGLLLDQVENKGGLQSPAAYAGALKNHEETLARVLRIPVPPYWKRIVNTAGFTAVSTREKLKLAWDAQHGLRQPLPEGVGGKTAPAETPAAPPTPGAIQAAEDKIEKAAPDDPYLESQLGKGYLEAGSPEDAERVLTRAIENGSTAPAAQANRALARAQLGRREDALRDAEEVLARDPGNKVAREVAAFARERRDFRRGLPPADVRRILAGTGSASKAPSAALTGTVARPLSAPPPVPESAETPSGRLTKQAKRKAKLKDLPGALLDASRAIDKDPKDSFAWSARAEISNKLGNYEGARADATEALRLDPMNAEAYRERSFANFNLGRYEEALADAETAVELQPRNALGYLYRAMAKEKLGDIPGALADYAMAAKLDPALKPLYDQALARLGPAGGGTEGPGGRSRRPWGAAAAAAALFGLALMRRRRGEEAAD